MKKVVITFSVLILLAAVANGQLNPTSSQYVLNPVSINPAFAGGKGALNIFTFYGKQWVGVDGSPSTLTVSADAPFANQKLGLGLMVISDKIGVTQENQITSAYAYKIHMEDGMLAFGLGAGIILTNTAYSDLIVLDPGDEIYTQDSKTFAVPNFSFGMHYSADNFFAGISIPRLLNYSFDFAKNKYVFDNKAASYSYLLNTGYIIDAGENIKISPSILLRYSSIPDPSKFQFDINTHLCLYDKFWLGGSYRNNRTIATMFQFQPNNQLRIAYSYNFEISELGRYSNGSHEIMMNYIFKYKVEAVNPLNF
ncbi:MAG: PorP/SprF family type IX secretion system membrane protein [Bacteroidota bacterium]